MSVTTPAAGPQPTTAPTEGPETGQEGWKREAAIARLKRKRKFAEDLFAYLAVNGVLWLIWLLSGPSRDGYLPWPAWVSIIWGFLLAIDAWRAYGSGPIGRDRPITEDEIQRELQRSGSG